MNKNEQVISSQEIKNAEKQLSIFLLDYQRKKDIVKTSILAILALISGLYFTFATTIIPSDYFLFSLVILFILAVLSYNFTLSFFTKKIDNQSIKLESIKIFNPAFTKEFKEFLSNKINNNELPTIREIVDGTRK